ncbi:MAG: hypothetical protein EP318_00860 [Rhodobacteraceae bacterium]|nr:MAG: hypothetical protein EP318_00860 [Paracoccaceae bacterium]
MTDKADLVGQWIEIAEEGGDGRHVFYRDGADIPPARGRRQLRLDDQGLALGGRPGPADRTVPAGQGGWHLEGEVLRIDLPGWEGRYDIEAAQGDKLILRQR